MNPQVSKKIESTKGILIQSNNGDIILDADTVVLTGSLNVSDVATIPVTQSNLKLLPGRDVQPYNDRLTNISLLTSDGFFRLREGVVDTATLPEILNISGEGLVVTSDGHIELTQPLQDLSQTSANVTEGQVLKYVDGHWVAGNDNTYDAGRGLVLNNNIFVINDSVLTTTDYAVVINKDFVDPKITNGDQRNYAQTYYRTVITSDDSQTVALRVSLLDQQGAVCRLNVVAGTANGEELASFISTGFTIGKHRQLVGYTNIEIIDKTAGATEWDVIFTTDNDAFYILCKGGVDQLINWGVSLEANVMWLC